MLASTLFLEVTYTPVTAIVKYFSEKLDHDSTLLFR